MNKQNTLSVILLSYYSKEKLSRCYERLNEVFNKENIPFELIIMDDGSKDESYAIALSLEKKYDNVRAYQLSRNYTSHYSFFAGMSVSKGQCVVAIPDDEQLPYDVVIKMYRLWEKGHKIIIPHRVTRNDPFVSKMFSGMFYKIMNSVSEIKFPQGGADIFMADREVIDILNNRIHPINTTTITEVLRLGFDPYFLPFERPIGDNKKSRWRFNKKVRLAMDFFFSSSSFPIKLITISGVFFAGISFLIMLFYIALKVFDIHFSWSSDVPGWTSTIVFISFFSGLILFSLGIIAEYIWRIYDEVKGRPGFIIRKKDDQ